MILTSKTIGIPHFSFVRVCSYTVFSKCHVVDDVSECEVCEVKWALAVVVVGVTEQL